MQLILIRHGESHSQLQEVPSSPSRCTGLTERGVRQVQALADRFRETGELHGYQVFLNSPVKRARQTAEILKEALSFEAHKEEDDLCVILQGEVDGRFQEIYRSKYGMPIPAEGEQWEAFADYARSTLQRYAAQYQGQKVVAVTHAEFIVASIATLFGRSGQGIWLEPTNAGITEWAWSGGRWSLLRYNDAYHVRGIEL